MSNLLEQAIVDAAALREVAMKNAEAALIEKYSKEFKDSVEKLLEQEAATATTPVAPDAAASIAAADPLAGTPAPLGGSDAGEKEKAFQKVKSSFLDGDDDELITIDFDQLKKQVSSALGGKQNPPLSVPEPTELDATASEEEAETPLEAEPAEQPAALEESLDEELEEELELDEEYEGVKGEDRTPDALAEENEEEQQEDKLLKKKKKNGDTMPALDEYNIELEEATQAEVEISKQIAAKEAELLKLKNNLLAQQQKDSQMAAKTPTAAPVAPTAIKEDIEISTEELAELAEMLNVDINVENLSDGHMGTTVTQKREQKNLERAAARDDKEKEHREQEEEALSDLKEKLEEAIELGTALVEENEDLKQEINEISGYLDSLKENVEKLSVSNAKLLYTNKILGNASLNERQKQQIVENISKCNSVLEAKAIYGALQGTVTGVVSEKKPKESLSEALNRGNSPFMTRKTQATELPIAERMKVLAGITKK